MSSVFLTSNEERVTSNSVLIHPTEEYDSFDFLNSIQNPRFDGNSKPWISGQTRNDGCFSEHSIGILLALLLLVTTLSYADEGATFSLKLSQNKAWLGEPVLARFTLSYPQTMKVDSVQFKPAGLKAFEVEELNVSAPEKKHGEVVQNFRYLLTPTKPGTLTILPQKIELAYQDKTNYRYITHTYHTNPVKITVREMPGALKVVGDYRMRLISDANRTLANRPIHLELHIAGIGNASYIPPFDLKIPGAIVYPSKPQVMTRWLGEGKYRTEFVQRFTVLADEDYTAPSLRFRYFNLQTELPEVLQTPPLAIEVKNPAREREHRLRLAIFTAGFVLGGFFFWLLAKFLSRRKRQNELSRAILKAPDDATLYRLLLPYSDRTELRPYLRQLEARLYGRGGEAPDRKKIAEVMRKVKNDSLSK